MGYCAVSVLTSNARECTQSEGKERKERMVVRLLINKGHIIFYLEGRGGGGGGRCKFQVLNADKTLSPS